MLILFVYVFASLSGYLVCIEFGDQLRWSGRLVDEFRFCATE